MAATDNSIAYPPELAGVVAAYNSITENNARAVVLAAIYAVLAIPQGKPASRRPTVPLTEPQQAVYDMIEERGVVKLDDLVAHLDRLDVMVDRRTVQRWCADNAGQPGPLHRAGVRGGAKGYAVTAEPSDPMDEVIRKVTSA